MKFLEHLYGFIHPFPGGDICLRRRDLPEHLHDLGPVLLAHQRAEVPHKMHLASLPQHSLKMTTDRLHQTGMVVRDHIPYSFKASFLELLEHLRPARFILRVGNPRAQNLPVPIRAYPYG